MPAQEPPLRRISFRGGLPNSEVRLSLIRVLVTQASAQAFQTRAAREPEPRSGLELRLYVACVCSSNTDRAARLHALRGHATAVVVVRYVASGCCWLDKRPVTKSRPQQAIRVDAGKQLFKWFAPLGLDEAGFRAQVYMPLLCALFFPGKNPKGGDRVPAPSEIDNCRPWLDREIELLQPQLVIPVGRLAIEQFLPARPLIEQVGGQQR